MKPYIDRTNLITLMVKKGKPVHLDVKVRGEPPPKITWILKETEVVTKANVEVITVDYHTDLKIKESVRANSGLYKITAVNEHGKDEADVEICILGEFISTRWLKRISFLDRRRRLTTHKGIFSLIRRQNVL